MKKIVLDKIHLAPGADEATLAAVAGRRHRAALELVQILKKSIDARDRGQVRVTYRAVFSVPDKDAARLIRLGAEEWRPAAAPRFVPVVKRPRVVIIGSGPAGLFAALRLLAHGVPSTILERGKPVERRQADIDRLRAEGVLDPESNVLFGEGGAGTWSDGKLTTRINKDGIDWIFDRLVEHGAPPAICYDAKPHVGTDVLSRVVASIRRRLEGGGCNFEFGAKVDRLLAADGALRAVGCADGREFPLDCCVAATGHSARDFYRLLEQSGVRLEAKGFAVGCRIEHPADFVNRSQYGDAAPLLGAADYRLVHNDAASGRGIYSFCMCPGGEVVNASSEPDRLCVNGMSWSRRDLPRSNAAIVVNLHPRDFGEGPLAGIEFQRRIEAAAFAAGGGGFASPAMSAQAFVGGPALAIGETSYRPGVREADLRGLFPAFVVEALIQGLREFDRKIKGFVAQGTLIGAETRTSSPVRISRGDDFQSPSLRGFFPAGEGAGYAGGIVSSAVDGLRIADRIAADWR